MNCIFCQIVEKKAHAEILYENDHIISFLDIRPVNLGHALVIPKLHYTDFLTIPENELDEIFKATQKVTSAIVCSVKPDGFNIVTNNGVAAGQSVFHFHLHIIPRFDKDNFAFRPIFKSYENNSMKDYADKIIAEIKL